MPTMQQMIQQGGRQTDTSPAQTVAADHNWKAEVNTMPNYVTMQGQMPGILPDTMQGIVQLAPQTTAREMNFPTGLSQEAIEAPMDGQEAYQGSLKALLARNVGHYVVATFLIGTQSPVSWEGFLHSVGNDYLVIFQPDQGRYITSDFYALKFVEFHDAAGVIPPCAGYRRRDGQKIW